MMLPGSALEARTSAHYLEVSRRYTALMSQEMLARKAEILAEREGLSRQKQLTRFAHPTYKYVAMKNTE